jgi:hypothetical protein
VVDDYDKAHEVWEQLYSLLRLTVFVVMDAAELNEDQREYVENKLHEELRYWPSPGKEK